MKRYGYIRHRHRCNRCGKMSYLDDTMFIVYHKWGIWFICQQCSERKTMPNIKITAEVDGKQVPLDNISTETFEAIKALEKPKEIPIPVARLADYNLGGSRLLFRPTEEIILEVGKVYGLDLEYGTVKCDWDANDAADKNVIRSTYKNIRPL